MDYALGNMFFLNYQSCIHNPYQNSQAVKKACGHRVKRREIQSSQEMAVMVELLI